MIDPPIIPECGIIPAGESAAAPVIGHDNISVAVHLDVSSAIRIEFAGPIYGDVVLSAQRTSRRDVPFPIYGNVISRPKPVRGR